MRNIAETTGTVLDPETLSRAQRMHLQKQLERLRRRTDDPMERGTFLHLGGTEGEDVSLPQDFSRVITKALAEVAAGRRVYVAAEEEELTTQEAADFLGVSRPYLVDLLENGEIPFHKVGTHRRVLFRDALAHRRRMLASQERAFEALTRQAQELGMGYEESNFREGAAREEEEAGSAQ